MGCKWKYYNIQYYSLLEEAPKGNGLYIYFNKKKELTKLYLVTGPLASLSRECSRQTVELKLISFKKKKNKFDFVASLTRAIKS